ncbi:MAG TPA: zinc dependent phospholipase C family protein [Longimicrobiales bacterium]
MHRIAAFAAAAFLLVLVLPGEAWAFGPATHVFLGQHLLDSLHLLPAGMAAILRRHPRSFLYGSIAADISLAKKYVPAGRHCHYWHVGEEIYARGADRGSEQLQAVGLGYLAHLAADTIAHNFFVPRQFVLTSSTKALGHAYWEHRLDVQLGERYTALAREVIMNFDHSEADALFDEVLSRTIFSFNTNLRIFRGMIHVQDNDRWHSVFERIIEKSRWGLSDDTIEGYMVTSFDYVVDYLTRRRGSNPAALDPVGEFNLHVSKQIRRLAIKEGAKDPGRLLETADDFFPIPTELVGYWGRRAR